MLNNDSKTPSLDKESTRSEASVSRDIDTILIDVSKSVPNVTITS